MSTICVLGAEVKSMRTSLIDQGYLDEQFIRLEDLQDVDENPTFVEEVVTGYFNESAKIIHNIEQSLENRPLNFGKLNEYILQLKGSSSSIGANQVNFECALFRKHCDDQNAQGCTQTLQNTKQAHAVLKEKLQTYFELFGRFITSRV